MSRQTQPNEPRLLLLEIVPSDRFMNYRSVLFPFIQGLAKEMGLSVAWLSFGVEAIRLSSGRNILVYDLPEDDRRALHAQLTGSNPTHVLINERLDPDFFHELRTQHAQIRFSSTSFLDRDETVGALIDWLGPKDASGLNPGALLVDSAGPDFEKQAANERIRGIQPLVHLVVGPECTYGHSVADNPLFEGAALTSAHRKRGCSFCACTDGAGPRPRTPPLELALRQVLAAERSLPWGWHRREYHVIGTNLLPRIDAFFEALRERDLPPSQFLFSCRMDEFLMVEEAVGTALRQSTATGHQIHICNMGVENFSQAENNRFNKGLDESTIRACFDAMRALEADFPDRFLAPTRQGFGFILFTPWTSLLDLRTNISAFRALGLDPNTFFMDNALQLFANRPITALAQRDGLLSDSRRDLPAESGCTTSWSDVSIPWRFVHPEVATIYRLARRLAPSKDIPEEDLDYQRIQRWKREHMPPDAPLLDVFAHLVETVATWPKLRTTEEVLQAMVGARGPARRRHPYSKPGFVPSRQDDRVPEPIILLVEFTAIGRMMVGVETPFLVALLRRDLGLPTEWVRLALEPSTRYGTGQRGLDLDPLDRRALLSFVSAHRPTHLVLSHEPSAALAQDLRAVRPGLLIGVSSSEPSSKLSPGENLVPSFAHHRALLSWLGVDHLHRSRDGTPKSLFETVRPDFAFRSLNAAAAREAPLGFIMAGAECGYRRSVARSPAYAGVDLRDCRVEGCAFCASGGGQSPWPGSAAERALVQIEAFHQTRSAVPSAPRARLRLVGHQLLSEIEGLAERLARHQLPGSDLIIDARADQLLRLSDGISRAAARLAGSGHKLIIGLIGVENFSRPELQRMNKGLAPWQNLAAVQLARRLASEHPATFGLPEAGGLSTILFTPWTRPEDLLLNLAVVEHFSLSRMCGKLLTSRLRLYPGLPMERLARRDGLIVQALADPAAETARRNFYPDEVPWRFEDPRTDPLCRISLRLQPSPELTDDVLYQQVQHCLGPSPTQAELVRRLAAMARRAADSPSAIEAEALLHPPSEAISSGLAVKRGPGKRIGAFAAEAVRMLRLQADGLSRVGRLEAVPHEMAASLRQRVTQHGRAVAASAVDPRIDRGQTIDLVFGQKEEDVAELVALTGQLHHRPDSSDLAAIKERIGILLGYPACCARSFSRVASDSASIYEWLFLLRRSREPGPVDPLINPFQSIVHVPCSFSCQESKVLAQRMRAALGEDLRHDLRAMADHPILFLLDRPGQWAELMPSTPFGPRFDFECQGHLGDDPRLQALRGGGTLQHDQGLITVDRAGQRLATFCLDAALFWHAAAVEPAFWGLVAEEALSPWGPPSPLEQHAAVTGGTAGVGPRPPSAQRSERLAAYLRAHLLPGRALVGDWLIHAVESSPSGYVEIRIGPSDAPNGLIVHVEPRRSAGPFYSQAGDWALSYDAETPLEHARQRSALRCLAAALLHLDAPDPPKA